MTPYRKVENCILTDEIVYMTADEETDYYISQATIETDENEILMNRIARYRGENIMVKREKVDFIDVSPQQIVSITTQGIPFLGT